MFGRDLGVVATPQSGSVPNGYAYGAADRDTTGASITSSFSYDTFGRQVAIPAAGDSTLSDYDDDLARVFSMPTAGGVLDSSC